MHGLTHGCLVRTVGLSGLHVAALGCAPAAPPAAASPSGGGTIPSHTHEADPGIRTRRVIERPVLPGRYGVEILAHSAD